MNVFISFHFFVVGSTFQKLNGGKYKVHNLPTFSH